MKKLMITAAVAMTAMVGFSIESSNIVGYQGVAAEGGKKCMIGATFQKVDGSSAVLGDIKINESFSELSDAVTILDEFGGAAGVYVYMTKATAEEFGFVEGWYDYYEISDWDGEAVLSSYNNVPLYDGEAVMVEAGNDGAALVFAGAVPLTATELECQAGQKTFLSNCTPIDRKLGDITVNASFSELSDTLTILDEFGGAAGVYVYMTAATAEEFGFVAGWYDYYEISDWDGESALTCFNTKDVPAGFGFMVEAGNEGAGIIVPASL